jgi:hypothetical protein
MHVLDTITALGFDSFLASLIIGTRPLSTRQQLLLSAAFGVCDYAASLAGLYASIPLEEIPQLPLYALCAALFALAARGPRRALIYALPILLSVDNLFSGVSPKWAPLLGFGSAVMALAGFGAAALGKKLLRTLHREAPWVYYFRRTTDFSE